MRKVTEQDFRKPEFVGKNPNDYEFRGDGEVVRKDRWEQGIQKIRLAVGHNLDEFEIDDIVEAVETLVRTLSLHDDVFNVNDLRQEITSLVVSAARELTDISVDESIDVRLQGIPMKIWFQVYGSSSEFVEYWVTAGNISISERGIRFKE